MQTQSIMNCLESCKRFWTICFPRMDGIVYNFLACKEKNIAERKNFRFDDSKVPFHVDTFTEKVQHYMLSFIDLTNKEITIKYLAKLYKLTNTYHCVEPLFVADTWSKMRNEKIRNRFIEICGRYGKEETLIDKCYTFTSDEEFENRSYEYIEKNGDMKFISYKDGLLTFEYNLNFIPRLHLCEEDLENGERDTTIKYLGKNDTIKAINAIEDGSGIDYHWNISPMINTICEILGTFGCKEPSELIKAAEILDEDNPVDNFIYEVSQSEEDDSLVLYMHIPGGGIKYNIEFTSELLDYDTKYEVSASINLNENIKSDMKRVYECTERSNEIDSVLAFQLINSLLHQRYSIAERMYNDFIYSEISGLSGDYFRCCYDDVFNVLREEKVTNENYRDINKKINSSIVEVINNNVDDVWQFRVVLYNVRKSTIRTWINSVDSLNGKGNAEFTIIRIG